MASVSMITLGGGKTTVEAAALDQLRSHFGDRLLAAGDAGYDEARTIWNAMIDKKPGLIARCRNAGDVAHAVNFARENNLLVAIHSAGHNIAGNAVCDGGLMIDLSLMKDVSVDAGSRTARVQPGVTLGELDAATQQHGLAASVGINSTTGIAGLTLGGGFGWISRKYGMTIDSLLSAEVVTADGHVRTG